MPTETSPQEASPTPSSQEGGGGGGGGSSRRKRESRAGTRSVSMLSPAQLERKRANDREAQRTIRQRTREHIETLERQVAELSGSKEQLDEALQRNAALEAEIDRLRQQLSTVNQQLRFTGAQALGNTAESLSTPSRSPIHHEMLVGQRHYSPMPQHSSTVAPGGQVSSHVGMQMNAPWDPYMLSSGSTAHDEYAPASYEQSIQHHHHQHHHHGQVMQQPASQQHTSRAPMVPSSSGMVYQQQQHHQMHPHHPHHPRS